MLLLRVLVNHVGTDLHLTGRGGLQLLGLVRKVYQQPERIMRTAYLER